MSLQEQVHLSSSVLAEVLAQAQASATPNASLLLAQIQVNPSSSVLAQVPAQVQAQGKLKLKAIAHAQC